jgi:hypothetical protein
MTNEDLMMDIFFSMNNNCVPLVQMFPAAELTNSLLFG